MIRILGIDPSTTTMGWGVVEVDGSEVKYVASGIFKPKATLSRFQRLVLMHTVINQVFMKWGKIKAVAFEDTFIPKFASRDAPIALGQAQGMIILTCGLHGIEAAHYTPASIKASVSHGGAKKEHVQAAVNLFLGTDVTNLDESDALAIALCHWSELRHQEIMAREVV